MAELPSARLRKVTRYAMQTTPDQRRLYLLVDLEDGGRATMGPFDREALIGLLAVFGTRYAGVDVALLVDPETDTIRIAFDGFSDENASG